MMLGEFQIHFKKLRDKWPKFYTAQMEAQVFTIVENAPAPDFGRWVDNALWSKDPPMRDGFYNMSRNVTPWGKDAKGEAEHLRIFTDEERKENWKLLWDVLYHRVGKDELKHRLQIMERTIQISTDNARRTL